MLHVKTSSVKNMVVSDFILRYLNADFNLFIFAGDEQIAISGRWEETLFPFSVPPANSKKF